VAKIINVEKPSQQKELGPRTAHHQRISQPEGFLLVSLQEGSARMNSIPYLNQHKGFALQWTDWTRVPSSKAVPQSYAQAQRM
jgi:hypothetical protein